MKTRHIVALAALAPLIAGALPAEAAVKKKKPVKVPTCFLVKDNRDDATGNGSGAVDSPNDPTADILSADIATNGAWATAVIRLASVDANPAGAPTGRAYDFTFLAPAYNKIVVMRALVNPAGQTFYDGKGRGSVEANAKEIRIHVPIKDLGIPLKTNDKLTELKASTWRWLGPTSVPLGVVDNGVGPKPYLAGWPSCIKVGP